MDFIHHDYLPLVDGYLIDWMRKPLGILILATIFAGLCGWVVHPHGYLVMSILLAVLVSGLVWPWLTMLGISAELEFGGTRGREGESVPVKLRIQNRMPWNAWGLGLQITETTQTEASVVRAAGWKTTVIAWDFVPMQRGEYPLNTPTLYSGFPFGLWKARRQVAISQRLLVWPSTVPVGAMPEVTGSDHHEGQVFRNKPGDAGDILGVRPFREGDSLRRIHWAQTARYDRLIVCERQTPGLPAIRITVDTDPAIHAGEGSESSREWVIRLAASFCTEWLSQGAQIEAIIQGKLYHAAGGTAQLRKLLDALARVQPAGDQPLAEVSRLPACIQCRASCSVVITTDQGMEQMPRTAFRGQHPLYVVLHRAAVVEAVSQSCTLPHKPWMEIRHRDELTTQLRTSWKGGNCGC
ncbi:MAG: DUF58 domain-containing protein [Planctomycetia bacterium]|nr:DUF58 domain-containing protein [Planctomycetia bacterium]